MKHLTIFIAAFLMLVSHACTETKGKEKLYDTAEMERISPAEYTTFKVSDNVTMYRVTFKNQYKMDVAGQLFMPKN